MTPTDACSVLRTRLVGLVADRLLMDGRLDELTVLARMSDVELDVLAAQEQWARRSEGDVWAALTAHSPYEARDNETKVDA